MENIIKTLSDFNIDYEKYDIINNIKNGLIDNMTNYEINEYLALFLSEYIIKDPIFDKIACHYLLLNIYENIDKTNYKNVIDKTNILSEDYTNYCYKNMDFINKLLDFKKDKLLTFFGILTLQKSYLLKDINGKIIETPQHLFLREAIQVNLNKPNNELIKETYDYLSKMFYTHASPTIFNSGTKINQLSSCFLLDCDDDMNYISKSWSDIASISKLGGGIAISLSKIRCQDSIIKSTNGKSDGIIPLCKVYQSIALYVNQSGKRNGALSIYIEPWHGDIYKFIDLRRITGNEDDKTRDLFLGLWIPDLFMNCVKNNLDWYLMDSSVSIGLTEIYGEEFEKLYYSYVEQNKFIKKIKAIELYERILESQIETGMPYMCYKDAGNYKSNQKNIGIIRSSNLCVAPETMILTFRGYKEIQTLENQYVNVYNGINYSNVKIIKTGIKQKLIKIGFSNGNYLECTPYHRFKIIDEWLIECQTPYKNYNNNNNIQYTEKYTKIVEATDLKIGMIIPDYYIRIDKKLYKNIKITSIEDNARYDDTYCFNEPILHQGIFNGILTMNCTEIFLHTSPQETAVCNLSSISLPKFVNEDKTFNYELLGKVAELTTYTLNNVIDVNYYPVKEAEYANQLSRPIGIGVSGLADVFLLMDHAYESPEAFNINKKIFECIYYHSLKSSNNIAKIDGPYEKFVGSPFSMGLLQFHLCGKTVDDLHIDGYPDFKWDELIEDIKKYGTKNSMLTAAMPTASSSQIIGNYESFEAYSSNIFLRKMGKHDMIIVNKHLIKELKEMNLWNDDTLNELLYYEGSIKCMNLPLKMKKKYKTSFEMLQKNIIQQSIDRSLFIDHSQSLNIFMDKPDKTKLSKCHFYGWQGGLKTGSYYIRSKPTKSAIKFGLDAEFIKKIEEKQEECLTCSA